MTPGVAALHPRTPRERRLAAGIAVSARNTEEVIYRGCLIGAAVTLFGVSPTSPPR